MVDLARQAFSTQNFNLAAEIYERQISEHGPLQENYLGLADAYARAGNLKHAFRAYTIAFRLGRINHNQLNHLVTSLIEVMTEKEDLSSDKIKQQIDIFACELCKSIWSDPVTIKCGHSFCRKCLEKSDRKQCKTCGTAGNQKLNSIKSTVLLASVVENWFPKELEALHLKTQGNACFSKHQYVDAIKYYSDALKYAPEDHLLTSNRSLAYASIEDHKAALEDADRVIYLQPHWPKGYFRRGEALVSLGRFEEACQSYLQCLTLDKQVTPARTALAKSLHKMLSPAATENLKLAELQQSLNPPSIHHLLSSAAQVETCISVTSLQQLKLSLRESLLTSGVLCNPDIDEDLSKLDDGQASSKPTSELSNLVKDKGSSSTDSLNAIENIVSRKRPNITHDCSENEDTKNKTKRTARAEILKPIKKRNVPESLLKLDDFECSLCFRLLYQPVTTPCGHSFCRQCLSRCLDHNSFCPLCKSSLVKYLAERNWSTTEALEQIIQTYFPEEYKEREKIYTEELAELAKMGQDKQHEIPIFVCAVGYPSLPCPLHIFEPRYRLLVRQSMESGTRQFGMCVAVGNEEQQFSDVGCMLEIRDVRYFPDGRSVVDTYGGCRFRVLKRSMRDGYNTAQVEWLKDRKPTENEVQEWTDLHNATYGATKKWYDSLPQDHQERIQQSFGQLPEPEHDIFASDNGPTWIWWITAIVPLDTRAQLSILSMCNLKDRLLAVKRILAFMSRHK